MTPIPSVAALVSERRPARAPRALAAHRAPDEQGSVFRL
jgi:hypothetical protein